MLQLILESILKKPSTVSYPKFKEAPLKSLRGAIAFIPENCIGCKICMKDCPAGAIIITKIGEKVFQAEIDLSKCIYCAQCVDSCPKKALEYTTQFELAALDKNKLKVTTSGKLQTTTQNETPKSE
ncbi:MAG: 4Fe-4S binding protein [Candidatus Saganbacteria bacterium]|nr:4Fe-4S binding protein [Candidatus Saganbacteria bacterium]